MKKILILCVYLFASYANAETVFSQCGYCSSSYSFSNYAESISSINGYTRNVIFVENQNTNIVEKYIVIKTRGDRGVPSEISSYKEALTNDENNKISLMQRNRSRIQDFFDTYNEAPEGIANSAYDLVNSSITQNLIAYNYINNQSLQQIIGDYTSVLIAIAGNIVGVNLVIEINFSDGSTAEFKIVGLDGTGSLALAVLNAVDSNGNNISLVKSGFNGDMEFYSNDSAFKEFQETVERLGIQVEIGSGGGSTGGGSPMVCRHVGGIYKCTVIKH